MSSNTHRRQTIVGHIADIDNRRFIDGEIHINNGRIERIIERNDVADDSPYIIPGFIDAHVHIESSMLLPSEYADTAINNGVIGCVCDPHEIANVCGMQGIDYMINDSEGKDFYFAFCAPSCVPATPFESTGFTLNAQDVHALLRKKEIFALAEMMNFPGVIAEDKEVAAKIRYALQEGKPIDGHAPMLNNEALKKYVKAGISTDHECSRIEEAEEKIRLGMNILIREGSAAKNFEALYPLIDRYPDATMFCADDIHPSELLNGYINQTVRRSIAKGCSVWNVLKAVSINPIKHYNLPIGTLHEKDSADFILTDNFTELNILSVYIKGKCVKGEQAEKIFLPTEKKHISSLPNNFNAEKISETDIRVEPKAEWIKVIGAMDKELLTKTLIKKAKIKDKNIVSDTENDVLKIVVYNRYRPTAPAAAFISGFGLKNGALASTIAHDSHNIIALGTSDELICKAINVLVENKGGICAVNDNSVKLLRLPFGGLMSDQSIETVSAEYEELNLSAKQMGCKFNAPFMTMAFMALLVIPEIKLSDKGLFDVNKFAFTSVFAEPMN